MKRSKGFTLIELLAVIVILAVIALIAIPQVLNILNKARLSAAEDTTYGIVKSAENYVTEFMLQNNGNFVSDTLEFKCENKKCELQNILENYNTENLTVLEFKGTKPTSGIVSISDNGKTLVATNLIINGFTCNYPVDGKAKCNGDGSDNTNENTTTTTTTTTVVVDPPCVETCYWYYTQDVACDETCSNCSEYYSTCNEAAKSNGNAAKKNAESQCLAGGGSDCESVGLGQYNSAYNNTLRSCCTSHNYSTKYYYKENNVKVEYSCEEAPSSTYTTSEIATSCE